MGATLTQAGLNLLAYLQAEEEALVVDKFIYADIDGLDPETTPPLTEAMPDAGDIVHEPGIAQIGKAGDDKVVFSSFLGTDVGDFYFNWIGLYCTEHSTLVAVTYVARQQKIASVGSTMGNCLTKNFTLQYLSLASIANVTIDAATWQLDLSAELAAAAAAAKVIGEIIMWPTSTAPANFLECDGSEVSRTTYADLFTAIGTTFGAGDGSTTFVLPDLRGEFVRGWDNGKGVDSGRTLGSQQADELKSHVHWQGMTGTTGIDGDFSHNSAEWYDEPARPDINTGATGGDETRPRNVALMYCIRYA